MLTNQIHDSITRLCKGQKEYTQTESLLKSLEAVLDNILQISRRPSPSTVTSINNGEAELIFQLPFERLSRVTERCRRDLETMSGWIKKLVPADRHQAWRRNIVSHLKIFIKDEELLRIRNVVSQDVRLMVIPYNFHS